MNLLKFLQGRLKISCKLGIFYSLARLKNNRTNAGYFDNTYRQLLTTSEYSLELVKSFNVDSNLFHPITPIIHQNISLNYVSFKLTSKFVQKYDANMPNNRSKHCDVRNVRIFIYLVAAERKSTVHKFFFPFKT